MSEQSFGDRIRELRIAKGYSLRALAEAVGIDYTYLSKVETGKFPPPSEDVIVRLADKLGEDADILLSLADKVSSEVREYARSHPEASKLFRALKSGNLEEAQRYYSELEKKAKDAEGSGNLFQ